MWFSSIQDPEPITSSISEGPSQDNKRPLNHSMAGTSKSRSTSESSSSVCTEKRLKPIIPCPVHRKRNLDKSLQDIINKWQLNNFTKCVYDNAVNGILDSVSAENDFTARENAISSPASVPHNSTLENEAVLMAIERKGLKQQDSHIDNPIDDISSARNRSFSSKINCFYNSADYHPDSYESNAQLHQHLVNIDESQETNFENNFMTTAVSAAIEEKGLSMYHV